METYVFPVASRLVSAPYGGISLCPGPSVQGNDERTRITAIVRHNVPHIRYSVESEGISCPYPRHIGFQDTHSGIADLLYDISLQQGLYTLFRMQVRLGPESYFYSLAARVVSEFLEIPDVAVQGPCLPVACSVAVVRKYPS